MIFLLSGFIKIFVQMVDKCLPMYYNLGKQVYTMMHRED